jgi:hypothetical protein
MSTTRIKTLLGAKVILIALVVMMVEQFVSPALRGAEPETPYKQSPGVQLSVELRDGSRVIGETMEDTLSFHSATLGEMKLRWSGIRTIDYGAETDAAHLTASNGDSFTVQLSADALRLKTEFGDTKLPMTLIRSIKVSLLTNSNGFAASGATNKRVFCWRLICGTDRTSSEKLWTTPRNSIRVPWET